ELWRELGKLLNEVYLESLEKSRGRQNDGLLDVLAFESVTSTIPSHRRDDCLFIIQDTPAKFKSGFPGQPGKMNGPLNHWKNQRKATQNRIDVLLYIS
ncbi:hypothetical protein, partial [Dysosmobacter sp.]|uniref:hypothetical protein n=1 Tax=Dysosmobacter sp. TaxID=2591382 RepID=UPI002A8EB944